MRFVDEYRAPEQVLQLVEHLQQRPVFSRHAHRIAKGAENHPRTAGYLDTRINADHGQNAHRAAGAVNKFNIVR